MAKIRSGILGNTRGKVAGVVASQWKDVNYIREYVKPGNPRTPAQLVQRAKMSACVNFSRPLVGPVFNAFWDPFLKSKSGFNAFVSANIKNFGAIPEYDKVQIIQGKLIPIADLTVVNTASQKGITVSWSIEALDAGVLEGDIKIAVYNIARDQWTFAFNVASVDDESYTVGLPQLNTGDEVAVYAYYNYTVQGILQGVSTSSSAVYTAL
ncbi:MAG: hypothetical protein GY799_28115 [Desulfobulbaceae bacterium]|nr:hypothetical protein [Desulfobulbaceae bacterium]